MMTEQMIELADYIESYEKKVVNNSDLYEDGAEIYVIVVKFNENWRVDDSEDGRISVTAGGGGMFLYTALTDDTKLNEIFSHIKSTIEVNLDSEKRVALYMEKSNILKDIFLHCNDYEKLKTVEIFISGEKYVPKPVEAVVKKQPARKAPQKKETAPAPFQEPAQESVEDAQKSAFKKVISKAGGHKAAASEPVKQPARKNPAQRKAVSNQAQQGGGMSLDEVEALERQYGFADE